MTAGATPCGAPFHADSGLGSVICFSCRDIGKCHISRDLISICAPGLALLEEFHHHVIDVRPQGERNPASGCPASERAQDSTESISNDKPWRFRTMKFGVVYSI